MGYVWEVWNIAYVLKWEDSYKGAGRYYMEMYWKWRIVIPLPTIKFFKFSHTCGSENDQKRMCTHQLPIFSTKKSLISYISVSFKVLWIFNVNFLIIFYFAKNFGFSTFLLLTRWKWIFFLLKHIKHSSTLNCNCFSNL